MAGDLSFGSLLRGFRLRARLTQEELAERAGMSPRGIRNLESARSTAPRLTSLRALAEALALDEDDQRRFDGAAGILVDPADATDATNPHAPVTTAADGGPIPVPLTPLIGRDELVDRLATAVTSGTTRLTTLTGMAGVGKTRLALAVADAVRDRLPTWWVPLAGVDHARYVLDAIAAAVDLDEVSLEAVSRRLGGGPSLLAVDNLEHLGTGGAVLGELLASTPQLTILATSRAPLGRDGERQWLVEPLPVPAEDEQDPDRLAASPSVALLVDRIRTTDPAFGLTADTAPIAADVCRRVGGLPLALELAAGTWRLLGTTGVRDLTVRQPLDLLDLAGHRPSAHRSLRAAIEATYATVEPTSQAALRQLSAFHDGWTIDAATAVLEEPAGLADVDRLAAIGLVKMEDTETGRRGTLLPIVHAFAAEAAADPDGAAEATAARHAAYFRRWCAALEEPMRTHASFEAFGRIAADANNTRAALRWFADNDPDGGLAMAFSLHRYWAGTGRTDEGLDWYGTFRDLVGDAAVAAQMSVVAAELAMFGGQVGLALELARQAVDDQRDSDDELGLCDALNSLGAILGFGGLDESVRCCEEAATLAEKLGAESRLLWALNALSVSLLNLGRLAEAGEAAQRALTVARDEGYPFYEGFALTALAENHRLADDGAAADHLLTTSTTPLLAHDTFAAHWLSLAAVVANGLGDQERAQQLAARAMEHATASGVNHALALAWWAAGEIDLAAGHAADTPLRRSLLHMRPGEHPLRVIDVLGALAAATDPKTAAYATTAADIIREREGISLPAPIAARLTRARTRAVDNSDAGVWQSHLADARAHSAEELTALLTDGM